MKHTFEILTCPKCGTEYIAPDMMDNSYWCRNPLCERGTWKQRGLNPKRELFKIDEQVLAKLIRHHGEEVQD